MKLRSLLIALVFAFTVVGARAQNAAMTAELQAQVEAAAKKANSTSGCAELAKLVAANPDAAATIAKVACAANRSAAPQIAAAVTLVVPSAAPAIAAALVADGGSVPVVTAIARAAASKAADPAAAEAAALAVVKSATGATTNATTQAQMAAAVANTLSISTTTVAQTAGLQADAVNQVMNTAAVINAPGNSSRVLQMAQEATAGVTVSTGSNANLGVVQMGDNTPKTNTDARNTSPSS
jgi:hypothetical protein